MAFGILYVIPTPIGNLQDITLRALTILQEVSYIACEDTRHTQKLLTYFNICGKNLISYHAHSGELKNKKILDILASGENVAVVSDAGTPGISDPGIALIATAVEQHIQIIPLPGATAFVPALIASGLPTDTFEFLGFLPHKKGRRTILQNIADTKRTVLFYESTHRIEKFLEQAVEFFPEKKIVFARELTKIYEEFLRGTATELLQILQEFPEKKKGEFVVIVSGKGGRKKA